MKELSTKPYLIRAIYEWCSESGYTPYLSVKVDGQTRVPNEFVRNGEIILNISFDAAHHLTLGNDIIQFSARFSGLSHEISIPVNAVQGIFAKETTQGILFPPEEDADTAQPANDVENPDKPPSSPQISPALMGKKRRFQVIK
ncbi:stringent starvation protein B [Nitrosospira sp. Nsp5]|uniref:Stringent starvation protein B n=1 Tax=Nitrosospira multiformis TaxID=1231 RepID=A0ABY0TB00_9PROT|nr:MULTISPECIES: ClpXP protease specificity-enhancing factor [Nitrosospira]PTR08360.1 stringent starvation protein B [Nitrosospira sp. Nsp5]SDQ55782.1 stringent starvation protein B [Nitrosospira multiformis]